MAFVLMITRAMTPKGEQHTSVYAQQRLCTAVERWKKTENIVQIWWVLEYSVEVICLNFNGESCVDYIKNSSRSALRICEYCLRTGDPDSPSQPISLFVLQPRNIVLAVKSMCVTQSHCNTHVRLPSRKVEKLMPARDTDYMSFSSTFRRRVRWRRQLPPLNAVHLLRDVCWHSGDRHVG